MSKLNRLNEVRQMNCGDYAKIIVYNSSLDCVVEFQDAYMYQCHVEYHNFKRGNVKNPYHPNRYGGYIGVGKYAPTENRKGTYVYDAWIRMLERSKNKKFKDKYPAYKDVDCCDEWLCFQNFAEWYVSNYYCVDGEAMEVDKDWTCIGNKLYCPEFCAIVPSIVNSCLLTHGKTKNKDLPTGICVTSSGKYKARISINCKRVDLGSYINLYDAMSAYKLAKIEYIKSLAVKYSGIIPNVICENMMRLEENFERVYPEYAALC